MATEKELEEQSRVRIEQMAIQGSQILTVLVGLPGTAEKGMAGDMAELKEHARKTNGRVRKLEIGLVLLIGTLSGLGILDYAVFNRVIGG